ncbi:cellulose binding elicitor [Brachionus plicatilis]|uniref:Cellulose binding elicitor n=1 Tax=Brachionus plicatilis TaxID=10195 RepID=A0A3M7S822_BRAPC|nr:cellulose binding elicitor [Brachionus plicatilis]
MKSFFLVCVLLGLSALAIAQQCTYETNIDYFGNDLSTYPVFKKSIDECCAACGTTAACNAWTFLPVTGACWLKYSVGSRRFVSDGRYSGVKQSGGQVTGTTITTTRITSSSSSPSSSPSTSPLTTRTTSTESTSTKVTGCFIETNINYAGNDLKGVGSVENASDCCNLCGLTEGCEAWSYYVEYSYCYLKSSSANKDSYEGMLSGVKAQV